MTTEREQIAADVETIVEPLIARDKYEGGYNCCGCSTYYEIIEHCIDVILNGPSGPVTQRQAEEVARHDAIVARVREEGSG